MEKAFCRNVSCTPTAYTSLSGKSDANDNSKIKANGLAPADGLSIDKLD